MYVPVVHEENIMRYIQFWPTRAGTSPQVSILMKPHDLAAIACSLCVQEGSEVYSSPLIIRFLDSLITSVSPRLGTASYTC